ncbi:tetratricopeptide (TPR) repeat protein [Sporomusaceae bacterium BoRhaA]|uniref:tetratricopeptide repeat-containing glycosyltransferase family 2 protein n=1 Tax=Pelorhabdus rhamnosifermentans TaxID=2772457 RepID=UPI001C061A48|nr:TPR domain-containing glycosyltransferase [Pelorhabdus rhamnosifermentans]MBU2700876.1 tetratricopeptide (TPR) repeat protein [Pelorhabdus rhamnosifermentans]
MKVSLCMIIKNETSNLYRCLQSAMKAVDEIIIMDIAATSDMCQIVRVFGAQVVDFVWNDNWNEACNQLLERARGEWILFLDADEELTPESAAVLRRIIEDDSLCGYFIRSENYLYDRMGEEITSDIVFRLFRNRSDYRFDGTVSEQMMDVIIEKNQQAKYSIAEDVVIFHYGYFDNEPGEKKQESGKYLNLIKEQIVEKPDDQLLRYHYGLELYRLGDYEQAATELIKAADELDCQTSYLPRLLHYIVLAYYVDKNYVSALSCIRQGLNFFPAYANLYYYQGLIYYAQQEYGLAYASFNHALATPEPAVNDVQFSGVRSFRSYYFLGQIAEMFYNLEEALRNYILALRENPSFVVALGGITRILQPKKDPVYAKAALEKICEFPSSRANYCIAQLLFEQAAYPLAYDYFELATQSVTESVEIKLKKAICLIQQRKFSAALRKLDSINPEHSLYKIAKFNKLFCFWLQGAQEKVRQVSEEMLALDLSQDLSRMIFLLKNNLGRRDFPPLILEKEGIFLLFDIIERTIALGEWERAITLLDGVRPESFNDMNLAIGELCFSYGNIELAEQYLNTHIDRNCQSETAYFILAQIKEQQGLYLDAHCCYRKSISINPKNPKYDIKLIQLYKKMRQTVIDQTIEKYPEISDLRTLLEAVSDK